MRVYVPKTKALTFSNGRWHGGEKREKTDAATELRQTQTPKTRRQLRKSAQGGRKQL